MVTATPTATARRRRARQPRLTAEQFTELQWCAADFWYFALNYVRVYDERTGQYIPFEPYDAQRELIDALDAGEWVWLVKARRLGATTAILIYIMWRAMFTPPFNADILSQKEPTAKGLLQMYKRIEKRLPEWMRAVATKSNETVIEYGQIESSVMVIVGGEGAARSEGLNLLLADEGAYIRRLGETRQAAQPTLETGGGVAAIVSTANGPGNDFHTGYMSAKAGRTKYRAMFFPWWSRPGRDQEWYDREARENADLHNYMAQEYPSNDEECFEASGGRVYPIIGRATHFCHYDRPTVVDEEGNLELVPQYRAFDWGTTASSPFVCLWLWHDPTAPAQLSFEPGSDIIEQGRDVEGMYADGYDEFFAYRRDPDHADKVIKENDHLPDALRYAVTHWRMTGHVHVYRALEIRSSDGRPCRPLQMFHRVMELSGYEEYCGPDRWVPGPNTETYAGTVGDRSGKFWRDMAAEQGALGNFQLQIDAHSKPPGMVGDEVEGGIAWVSALAGGLVPWRIEEQLTRKQEQERGWEQGEKPKTLKERRAYVTWRQRLRDRENSQPLYGYGRKRQVQ